jgi:hypothetical protein
MINGFLDRSPRMNSLVTSVMESALIGSDIAKKTILPIAILPIAGID